MPWVPSDALDEIASEVRHARAALTVDTERLTALEELLDIALELRTALRRRPTVADLATAARHDAHLELRLRYLRPG
jgi:hypothetical protein